MNHSAVVLATGWRPIGVGMPNFVNCTAVENSQFVTEYKNLAVSFEHGIVAEVGASGTDSHSGGGAAPQGGFSKESLFLQGLLNGVTVFQVPLGSISLVQKIDAAVCIVAPHEKLELRLDTASEDEATALTRCFSYYRDIPVGYQDTSSTGRVALLTTPSPRRDRRPFEHHHTPYGTSDSPRGGPVTIALSPTQLRDSQYSSLLSPVYSGASLHSQNGRIPMVGNGDKVLQSPPRPMRVPTKMQVREPGAPKPVAATGNRSVQSVAATSRTNSGSPPRQSAAPAATKGKQAWGKLALAVKARGMTRAPPVPPGRVPSRRDSTAPATGPQKPQNELRRTQSAHPRQRDSPSRLQRTQSASPVPRKAPTAAGNSPVPQRNTSMTVPPRSGVQAGEGRAPTSSGRPVVPGRPAVPSASKAPVHVPPRPNSTGNLKGSASQQHSVASPPPAAPKLPPRKAAPSASGPPAAPQRATVPPSLSHPPQPPPRFSKQ
jgi:hypothetical protein